MHYSVTIAFDADSDDEATAKINSWSISPGLTVTISSYSDPVIGTTGDGGELVVSDSEPAP